MAIRNYCSYLLALLAVLIYSETNARQMHQATDYAKRQWVDSVYDKLTQEERIGQLFMVAAYSGGPNFNDDKITQLINAHQVGGLILMQGGPVRQAMLTN